VRVLGRTRVGVAGAVALRFSELAAPAGPAFVRFAASPAACAWLEASSAISATEAASSGRVIASMLRARPAQPATCAVRPRMRASEQTLDRRERLCEHLVGRLGGVDNADALGLDVRELLVGVGDRREELLAFALEPVGFARGIG
jgi:hypothetical protein